MSDLVEWRLGGELVAECFASKDCTKTELMCGTATITLLMERPVVL